MLEAEEQEEQDILIPMHPMLEQLLLYKIIPLPLEAEVEEHQVLVLMVFPVVMDRIQLDFQ